MWRSASWGQFPKGFLRRGFPGLRSYTPAGERSLLSGCDRRSSRRRGSAGGSAGQRCSKRPCRRHSSRTSRGGAGAGGYFPFSESSVCWDLVSDNSRHHVPLSDFWKGALVLWTNVTAFTLAPPAALCAAPASRLFLWPRPVPQRFLPRLLADCCSGARGPLSCPHGLCFPKLNSISVVVWSAENRIAAFLCIERFISINGGFIFPFGFFKHISSCGEY